MLFLVLVNSCQLKRLFVKKEQTTLFLVNNAVAGSGIALGPTISAAITTSFDGKRLHMDNNDGLPCLIPVFYGITLTVLLLLFFPKELNDKLSSATAESPTESNSDSAAQHQDAVISAQQPDGEEGESLVVKVPVEEDAVESAALPAEPTLANKLAVATTLFVSLTRMFIRLAWETGAISVLANIYRQGAHAGFFIGVIVFCYPFVVILLTLLSKYWNDHQLMFLLETMEVLGALMLFRWYLADGDSREEILWRTAFLVGSACLYYSNNGQSGILSSQLMKNSVVGDKWLDPNKLLSIYQILGAFGMGFGPFIIRRALSMNYSQNQFALVLGLTTLLQTTATGGYFCWSRATKAKIEV